jgi:hypothetical protein
MRPAGGALVFVALALALTALPARALQLEVGIGGAGAVGGTVDAGGATITAAVLWPVEGLPLRFGVMGHGADLGTRVGTLYDVHDRTFLGDVATLHRQAWGASWRMDAAIPIWHGLHPVAGGTWGYYRIADDVRGHSVHSAGATGFGLSLGIERPVGTAHAAGLVVRYHRMFNDVAGRYVAGAFTWRWSGRAAP